MKVELVEDRRLQLRCASRPGGFAIRPARATERASHRFLRAVTLAVFLGFPAMQAVAELAVPLLTGRIVDQAGMLGGDVARVEMAIHGLEQATGGQMAILTMPTLGNDALESFSMRVAEKWKIGRKGQDNGALLLLVRDSHKIRLEIGYGWEGSINDARAGDIIRGMGPFFRAGHFGDGCVYAVGQVQGFVTGKPAAGMPVRPVTQNDHSEKAGELRVDPVIIFAILFGLIIFISSLRSNRHTYGGRSGGGWYSSGGGFSSGGGSGFSGGGGSFGGGGASGSW